MLTPEQIDVLRDRVSDLTTPLLEYLLQEIARRISQAGQLSSTAAYQIWKAQTLGMSQRDIKKELRRLLGVSHKELRELLTQSAKAGYRFDLDRLPTNKAIPFEENEGLQRLLSAAIDQAKVDFTNLTQTLGLVAPDGKAYPLQKAYQKACDFAFEQVFTGTVDYNTAIRQATKNLADRGLQTIDYESGVSTSLDAAVRRNIMGGLGLLQERISRQDYEDMGADGWEISAHSNSAPDHEPIQGLQYSDEKYQALNNSLVRRIGTLSCGHAAFPIILGINRPQYTPEELQRLREKNAVGITYQGRHYTGYQATQMQRRVERGIRKQKNRILVDEATGDKDRLQQDQIRLGRLRREYKEFSKAAGLRTQDERARVVGFGRGEAARAAGGYKSVAKVANSMYDIGTEKDNIDAYLRDISLRREILSDRTMITIQAGQQRKHIAGTLEYNQYVQKLSKEGRFGPSRLSITQDEAQALVYRYRGTGILRRSNDGRWMNEELITNHPEEIGIAVNDITGAEARTTTFKIHYGGKGTHIVPDYPSKKGAKSRK